MPLRHLLASHCQVIESGAWWLNNASQTREEYESSQVYTGLKLGRTTAYQLGRRTGLQLGRRTGYLLVASNHPKDVIFRTAFMFSG